MSENISVNMEDVTGTFDFGTDKITCVQKKKYGTVKLCFRSTNSPALIPFAEIKLYDSNLAKDADMTFDDAVKLGEEICKRWNEGIISE